MTAAGKAAGWCARSGQRVGCIESRRILRSLLISSPADASAGPVSPWILCRPASERIRCEKLLILRRACFRLSRTARVSVVECSAFCFLSRACCRFARSAAFSFAGTSGVAVSWAMSASSRQSIET